MNFIFLILSFATLCLTKNVPATNHNIIQTKHDIPYVLTSRRLMEIRNEFMYWYSDHGGNNNNGDYQSSLRSSVPQIQKDLNFNLPFFGFRFNYTRVSLNGYLEFSDPPEQYTYPLVFPVKDWPKKNDPSFIGIFYSKMRIGSIQSDETDQRRPGVYFRIDRDLHTRIDQQGVEMRERIKWDIREGIIGAETFEPKHAITVTWKNMTFAGGIDNSLYITNTFQLVLATDEVFTYAIFNYLDMQWTTHTEAGGDTTSGEGGTPAFVGFNAGNGTQSYEYYPYSQRSTIRDLTRRGWTNGFKGRHIFRIDESVKLGSCNDFSGYNLPLFLSPESGNMLGGTVVNITGPCFDMSEEIICQFGSKEVKGIVINRNRAICVQPPGLFAEGYIPFKIKTSSEMYSWKGQFFIESPATAIEKIHIDDSVHEKSTKEIRITWEKQNLTINEGSLVQISLWGYYENMIRRELVYIDNIESSITNTGEYIIRPSVYKDRENFKHMFINNLQFGFLQINVSDFGSGLWSRPIPLAWYFGPQWEKLAGKDWPQQFCQNWISTDRNMKNFTTGLSHCPCTLQHAINDKGRFLPDFDCDKDSNPKCLNNRGAIHCVRSTNFDVNGAEQQCCYDKNEYLMLSQDQQWGSKSFRSHNLGSYPWNTFTKVPSLSHWYHDIAPFYTCCRWQNEHSEGCETLRFERRKSDDCTKYQSPQISTVFGDPHIITFDSLEYTFNGMGEFTLVRTDTEKHQLDIQGRFEKISKNIYGEATQLTSVVARTNYRLMNSSTIIEIKLRPQHAQWRYRLDVLADGKRVYFDKPSMKVQHFSGVTVYTPSNILNQSEVIVMFNTGAGIEVIENQGILFTRVYLPPEYINKTRGLLGNWSNDMMDDFIKPDGTITSIGNLKNLEAIHKEFGMSWLLSDKDQPGIGPALFHREYSRDSSYYTNKTFVPMFYTELEEIIPPNHINDIMMIKNFCGDLYQCRYDYALTMNKNMAQITKKSFYSYMNIRNKLSTKVISCGVLETPKFGRKSTFLFVPGTIVIFECNKNYILEGDLRRTCQLNGKWNIPKYGYTKCIHKSLK